MDIQLTQILFQVINFSVVVGAVGYLLFKPVLKIFDERARRIAEGEKAAIKAQTAYAQIEQNRKTTEASLKKERSEIIKAAQVEAQERKEAILADAKAKAKAITAELKDQWEAEKIALYKKSQNEMTEAVITISEKVIASALDKKTAQKLIDTQLKEIIKAL